MILKEQIKLFKESIKDKNAIIKLLKEVISDQQAEIDFLKENQAPTFPELPSTPEFML